MPTSACDKGTHNPKQESPAISKGSACYFACTQNRTWAQMLFLEIYASFACQLEFGIKEFSGMVNVVAHNDYTTYSQ